MVIGAVIGGSCDTNEIGERRLEHTYRGKYIKVTEVLPANSNRWTASIAISESDGFKVGFSPHGRLLSLPTAAEAEWEDILYATKGSIKNVRKSSCWSPREDVGTLG